MEHRKLARAILAIILMVAGVAGVSAAALDARALPGHSVLQLAPGATGWQQVNSNGFGDSGAGEVSALEAFKGYLYAGTHNPIDPAQTFDGARIFRSPDGATWTPVTDPGFGITHDIAPPAILDFAVFNSRLYASTGRGDGPGQIWRTLDGTTWAPMVITGFSDPDTVDITALAVYDGLIYAGATNLISGAQIWRSFTGDNNTWTQVAPATPGTAPATVTGMAVFDGGLYAAVESDAPAQIWLSYGGDWTTIVSDGFGDSKTISTGGMAVFAGYLYVGAGNSMVGAQLWRTNDGANWEQAIDPGFGDPNNQKVETVFVFGNYLYISVSNTATGIEVWRSADGALWEQSNPDGFGDSNNTGSNWSNATTAFLSRLYVGTSNVADGGELWELTPTTLPVYGVNLSPDATLGGLPGTTVTHTLTITNTGNVTDTFNLAKSGNKWVTLMSTSAVTLPPGTSDLFTVSVSVPAGALATASDTVTITAVSQGDSAKSDSANLTTTVRPSHGLNLSPDQAKVGLAGQTVTYTLWITNTGIAADTFDLAKSGNKWPTALSVNNVSLGPGLKASISVAVQIPANASPGATDAALITATSRGDSMKSKSTLITTTVQLPGYRTLLPLARHGP